MVPRVVQFATKGEFKGIGVAGAIDFPQFQSDPTPDTPGTASAQKTSLSYSLATEETTINISGYFLQKFAARCERSSPCLLSVFKGQPGLHYPDRARFLLFTLVPNKVKFQRRGEHLGASSMSCTWGYLS